MRLFEFFTLSDVVPNMELARTVMCTHKHTENKQAKAALTCRAGFQTTEYLS